MDLKKSLDLALNLQEGDKNPLPKWLWRVESLPPFGDVTLDAGEYILQCALPFPQFDTGNQIAVAGTTLTFPGKMQINSFNLLVHEDNKARALKYALTWMSKIRNFTSGGYYPPKSYKKSLKVNLFDNKGDILITATLTGVWPSVLQDWELVYNDDGFHQMSIQLEVDGSNFQIF
jgi:hypothetical protein